MSRVTSTLLAVSTALAVAAPVAATDDVEKTTISAIERGEAPAELYLEGAVLDQLDEGGYLFSDGTGVIDIVVGEDAGEGELPLFELVRIDGAVAGDAIDVHDWAPLPIFTPAVIVEEPQVIEAFWNWIILFGSQAPEPTE
jgi:uncharacterized protein YdeI (BOF family)